MSSPQVFFLGATGYVGGTTLAALITAHPSWPITILTRTGSQTQTIRSSFPEKDHPGLTTVTGTLDDTPTLARHAAQASIVLQLANADHGEGTDALLATLAASVSPQAPKYYIHLSGAATILDFSLTPGLPSPKTWSDTADLDAITSMPATQLHATIEQRVIATGLRHADEGLRVAIVSPPMVVGRGPRAAKLGANPYVNAMLRRKKAFVVGEGRNIFNRVNVGDLASAIVALVEAAVGEIESGTQRIADWNKEGYYFVSDSQEKPDANEYARSAARILKEKGKIETEDVETISPEEATKLHPFGPILFGGSVQVDGRRLRERLGWVAQGRAWEDVLREDVEQEIEREERGESLGTGFGKD